MILDSTDLLQVCLGPFAFLFPQGLQSSACLVIFLRIYEECGLSIPISPLYLNVDGVLIGLFPQVFVRYGVLLSDIKNMAETTDWILVLIVFVTFQVSEPYNRTDLT